MNDREKSREELIQELEELRRRIAEIESTGLPAPVAGVSQAIGRSRELQVCPERYLLNAVLDSNPDHICFKDTAGRIVRVNKALADWFGLSDPAQAVGKTDRDFYTPDYVAISAEAEQIAITTGQPVIREVRGIWPAAPDKSVLTIKMPVHGENGQVIGTFGIFSDVTPRREAEAEYERILDNLERRSTQLITAAEVARAASSILDPDDLIPRVVNLVRERFELYYAGLFLVDETGEWTGEPGRWAVLRAGTGQAGREMLQRGHKLEIGETSMIGWCIAHKQARIALDVGEDRVRFENPLLPETRSELALPLISRGQPIGALTIQSTEAHAFSQEDITTFQALADQLANAIANARLYDQAQRELVERKRVEERLRASESAYRRVLDGLEYGYYEVDLAGNMVAFNPALCKLLGYPADELVGMNNRQYMDTATARHVFQTFNRVYRTGRPVHSVEWPIITKSGECRTVEATVSLVYDSAGEPAGFQGIVRDVTAQKEISAEKEQLLQTLERRTTELQTAAEVSRAVSSILDPEALFPQLVDLVRERFELYYAGLFLVDETGEWTGEPGRWAVLRAGTGEAGREMLRRGHKLEIGETSMIGWCIAHKRARIALDVGEDRVRFENPLLPETRSELALPLINRGRPIGALTIQSSQEAAFSQEDITVLQTMADHLANAIANARLYNQAQREINERRRIEEALRLSEERHRLVVENANDAICVVQDGKLTFANPRVAQLAGYPVEELIGKPFLDWIHPEDRALVAERHTARLKGFPTPRSYSFRIVDRSGETRYVELNSLLVQWEGKPATLNFLTDITERRRTEEALARERHLFRVLLDAVPDAIYFKDRESRFIEVSRSQAGRFGVPYEEILGKTDFDFFTLEHAQPAYDDEQWIIRTGETVTKEEKETWPDGRVTWVLTTKLPLRDETGQIIGTFGISTDITARRQAEEELRLAHEELAQYTENLERRTAQLQVGAEVAREAAGILDVQRLLDTAVRLISERFGFYHAGVFLVDELGEYAVLRAASSPGGQRMLARGHKLPVGKLGIVGYVAATGEPRIALDVGKDAVFFNNPDLPETRSEMGLPLKVRDRTIGVLDVQSVHEAAFSDDDIAVLQTLADQLAVAIDNARLVERTEAQLHELSLLYGEYTAATWAELAAAERPLSYVYDRIDVLPAERAVARSDLSVLDRAVLEGKTTVLVEPEMSKRMLATPLKLRDQVIGSLGIQETNGGRGWSPAEVSLIETVSEQVALALENARHFAETQRSAQQMKTLNELAQTLATRLTVQEVLEEAFWGASRMLDTHNFYIALYDADTDTLTFPLGIEEGQRVEWPARQGGNGISEYIIRTRQPLLIKENVNEWMAREGIESIGTPALCWMGVPLFMGERVIGVIGLQSHTTPYAYNERDLALLTAIASQVAIALQNARLFEQVQKQAERQRQIYEITSKLRRTPDIDWILKTAVEELGQALRVNRAIVRLVE